MTAWTINTLIDGGCFETKQCRINMMTCTELSGNILSISFYAFFSIVISIVRKFRMIKNKKITGKKLLLKSNVTLKVVGQCGKSNQGLISGLMRSLEYIQTFIWRNSPKTPPHWTTYKVWFTLLYLYRHNFNASEIQMSRWHNFGILRLGEKNIVYSTKLMFILMIMPH